MVSLFILKMMEFVQIQLCARHFSEECFHKAPVVFHQISTTLRSPGDDPAALCHHQYH